jgi:murein L,D-transpeptidase YcbB/YkuD
MNRKTLVAAGAGFVSATLALALGPAAPARAQVLTDPAGVAATPAAQAAAGAAMEAPAAGLATEAPAGATAEAPAADGRAASVEPSTASQPAPYAPASAETAIPAPGAAPAATAAAPATDPIVDEVRQQLAQPARGNVDRGDRAALVAYYAEASAAPLWVKADGFSPRARHALAEIRRAEDWGLSVAAFELPQLASGETRASALAAAEIKLSLAALEYARHARGGRLDPSQVSRSFDQKPTLLDPKQVLAALAATDTPGSYLQGLHPKHPQFERLRQALLRAPAGGGRPDASAEPAIELPNGPTLRPGMEHPHVAFLRQRLEVPARAGARDVYDDALAEAVMAFQRQKGIRPADGVVSSRTRAALNGGARPAEINPASDLQRIIANMERWRWLPEDLGKLYVWDNVPEFTTRVVKNGRLLHQAKIIVGKPDTQTVMFSANMRYVVFGPEWGVPDSIKLKEILPYLRPGGYGIFGGFGGTDTRVLERHNLRVSYNGRPVDASQVDWSQVDIRRFTFIQPPGASNVLGAVKFRFPNKHDIYMHDTPQRELFEKPVRAFSHGCMRVQNPGKLAEILLAEDKGWSAEHVRDLMARGGNNEITLSAQIPVHVTYFTAVAGEDGHVKFHADLYGHDRRLIAALAGKPLPLEPAPNASDAMREASQKRGKAYQQTSNDFFQGLFGN